VEDLDLHEAKDCSYSISDTESSSAASPTLVCKALSAASALDEEMSLIVRHSVFQLREWARPMIWLENGRKEVPVPGDADQHSSIVIQDEIT